MDKFSSLLKPHRYDSLTQDSQVSDSMEKLLEPQELEARTRHGRSGVLLTWCRAAYLLIAWVLTASFASLWLNALVNPSDLRGIGLKDLELKAAESWIERDIVKFTGTPVFESEEVVYREYNRDYKQYLGNSTEAQDNWHELLRDRYFLASEDEMKAIYPNNYKDYYHTALGWWIGLDGFHILHCVRIVGKALDKARSGTAEHSEYQRYHEDHCLDIIRQSVQCNMDLTPIPERRWPTSEHHFIDSNQPHVCRNLWTMRKFLDMRQNRTKQLIAEYEAREGKPFVEEESAMGVFGFPEWKGHEKDYRPPYLADKMSE